MYVIFLENELNVKCFGYLRKLRIFKQKSEKQNNDVFYV